MLSDGVRQFAIDLHALYRVHAERLVYKPDSFTNRDRAAAAGSGTVQIGGRAGLRFMRQVPVLGPRVSSLMKLSNQLHVLQEILVLLCKPVTGCPINLHSLARRDQNLAFGGVFMVNLNEPMPCNEKSIRSSFMVSAPSTSAVTRYPKFTYDEFETA